jgi:histidine ammonia-lyase
MSQGDHNGPILLDGNSLTLEQVREVARDFMSAALGDGAKRAMMKSRALVDRWVAEGKPIYGINTGFGSLQNKTIPADKVEQLQENIVLSHAAGIGRPLAEEIVRAMMLLRANALAKGYSGIRVEVVERLLDMLNRRVHPVVPEKGSVGSSGDLAPLAHMTLPLIGRGQAFYEGERLSGAEAMKRAGIEPVVLNSKEGLALTNGTQFMSAIGVLALLDAEDLAKTADVAGALSLEAMNGNSDAFNEQIHRLRPFKGQIDSASNIRLMIAGSKSIDVKDSDKALKLQDAYSLRCLPQVHGASRQAIGFVRNTLEIEINAATDNPLILCAESSADRTGEDLSISAGNFHGQPVALSLDFLSLALAEIGNISERRVAKLMNENENRGLPAYLMEDAGLNTGMMIVQYTAAALVSENKVLIHPASGDSIPTSANQEDHNSMGSIAARQAREVLENVQYVLGIELLCAAQAIGFRIGKNGAPGVGTKAAYDLIRKHVSQRQSDQDGEIHEDIQKVQALVRSGEITSAVNDALTSAKPPMEVLA